MSVNLKAIKVGILGGGQLGRMLVASAAQMGVRFGVLDPDAESPCRELDVDFSQGDFRDYANVLEFGKKYDVVTIEIENVAVQALKRLRDDHGIQVYPQPEVIELIQDKGLQKEFYRAHHIPTADFVLIEGCQGLQKHPDFFPCFQKLRKSGYDGRGVCCLESIADKALAFDAPSVLEKAVNVQKEIAVIVARSLKGQIKTFPIVEMALHPQKHLVDRLFAPARLLPEQVEQAYHLARQVAEQLGIVGVLAVEMFVDGENRILVNEMAPRPHNSGHHTIEANETSQYRIHLESILGLEMGSTRMLSPSAMLNLLGEDGFEGPVSYEGLENWRGQDGVFVHDYGKRQTRPYRKMGHVTVLSDTVDEALRQVQKISQSVRVKS